VPGPPPGTLVASPPADTQAAFRFEPAAALRIAARIHAFMHSRFRPRPAAEKTSALSEPHQRAISAAHTAFTILTSLSSPLAAGSGRPPFLARANHPWASGAHPSQTRGQRVRLGSLRNHTLPKTPRRESASLLTRFLLLLLRRRVPHSDRGTHAAGRRRPADTGRGAGFSFLFLSPRREMDCTKGGRDRKAINPRPPFRSHAAGRTVGPIGPKSRQLRSAEPPPCVPPPCDDPALGEYLHPPLRPSPLPVPEPGKPAAVKFSSGPVFFSFFA
jgi:hypothetical protein